MSSWNSTTKYGKVALVAAAGTVLTVIVTKTIVPLFVVGFGLYILYAFYSGLGSSGSGAAKQKVRKAYA